MKFKLSVSQILEFGQRKDSLGNPHQEDSIYPALNAATPDCRLFLVCDGMGGHAAGEVASATVCQAMSDAILAHWSPGELLTDEVLINGISAAYDALDRHDSDPGQEKKMGTTMTFLCLHAGGATVAHIGDSRVYHIRPGESAAQTCILHQTSDHSLVNELVKIGEMTPEEAKVSPRKNVITRAMQPGMPSRSQADIHHITDIRPGDYFYMCSDGMLEQAEAAEICRDFSALFPTDEQKVANLIDETINNRDNHSAIIVHILDVEGAPVAYPAATPKQQPVQRPIQRPMPQHTRPAIASESNTQFAAPAQNDAGIINAAPAICPASRKEISGKINRRAILIAIIALVAVVALSLIFLFTCGRNDKPASKTPATDSPSTETPQIDADDPEDSGMLTDEDDDEGKDIDKNGDDEEPAVPDTNTDAEDETNGGTFGDRIIKGTKDFLENSENQPETIDPDRTKVPNSEGEKPGKEPAPKNSNPFSIFLQHGAGDGEVNSAAGLTMVSMSIVPKPAGTYNQNTPVGTVKLMISSFINKNPEAMVGCLGTSSGDALGALSSKDNLKMFRLVVNSGVVENIKGVKVKVGQLDFNGDEAVVKVTANGISQEIIVNLGKDQKWRINENEAAKVLEPLLSAFDDVI